MGSTCVDAMDPPRRVRGTHTQYMSKTNIHTAHARIDAVREHARDGKSFRGLAPAPGCHDRHERKPPSPAADLNRRPVQREDPPKGLRRAVSNARAAAQPFLELPVQLQARGGVPLRHSMCNPCWLGQLPSAWPRRWLQPQLCVGPLEEPDQAPSQAATNVRPFAAAPDRACKCLRA